MYLLLKESLDKLFVDYLEKGPNGDLFLVTFVGVKSEERVDLLNLI